MQDLLTCLTDNTPQNIQNFHVLLTASFEFNSIQEGINIHQILETFVAIWQVEKQNYKVLNPALGKILCENLTYEGYSILIVNEINDVLLPMLEKEVFTPVKQPQTK